MTNPDPRPDEVALGPRDTTCGMEVLAPREVPLGGPRAMTVRRTLPSRARTLIGAWCFVDHYGPDDVADSGGMNVPAHPHTGLQTVSWLFSGEIEHRDSAGNHAMVRSGELNLMTGGRGISHSEVSTAQTTTLHGAQLWVALPEAGRYTEPALTHFAPDPVRGEGWEAKVFLGSLLGETSPVATHTPLLGAELLLDPGVGLELDVEETYEHGVLIDTGDVGVRARKAEPCPASSERIGSESTVEPGGSSRERSVTDLTATPGDLVYIATGHGTLTVRAGAEPVRLLLLGGPPFGEEIVMWWNFVGRSHEEIVAFRQEWQDQITRDGAVVGDGQEVAAGRFGIVVGDHLPPIPAPELPNARLRTRR